MDSLTQHGFILDASLRESLLNSFSTETIITFFELLLQSVSQPSDNGLIELAPSPVDLQQVQPEDDTPLVLPTRELNIDAIDADIDLHDCTKSLEFILVSLSQALSLTPVQSASLLTDSNSYLVSLC